MTIKEFMDAYNISPKGFAEACEINYSTFWTYVSRHRTPCLRASVKMVLQSGGLITLEDLLRKDQPLLWKRKPRLLKRNKMKIRANIDKKIKRKRHYRKAYYKVIVDDL